MEPGNRDEYLVPTSLGSEFLDGIIQCSYLMELQHRAKSGQLLACTAVAKWLQSLGNKFCVRV